MKPARILQPALAVLTACVALAQQGAAPPDEEDTNPPEETIDWTTGRGVSESIMQRLDQLVPVGRAHEGLVKTMYTERTEKDAPMREAVFRTARMQRMDQTHLRFKDADFASYGDPAAPDTATRTVASADLIYDLVHDFVFTNAPVRIDDKNGSIHGGAMLHDRATGLTIFSGGVELYLSEPDEEPAPAAPAAEPKPDKP